MYSISPTVPPRRNYKPTTPIPAPRRNLPPPPPKVNEIMLFIVQSVRGGFSMGLWGYRASGAITSLLPPPFSPNIFLQFCIYF